MGLERALSCIMTLYDNRYARSEDIRYDAIIDNGERMSTIGNDKTYLFLLIVMDN